MKTKHESQEIELYKDQFRYVASPRKNTHTHTHKKHNRDIRWQGMSYLSFLAAEFSPECLVLIALHLFISGRCTKQNQSL